MRRRLAFFLFGTSIFSSLPTLAACLPKYSNLDEVFGAIQLGQPHTDLPETVNPKVREQCRNLDNALYDCIYEDKNGVQYIDDGDGVLEKDWLVENIPPGVTLPFGLTPQDTIQDVLKKTAPYRKLKYRFEKDGIAIDGITSGYCYKNALGKVFSFNFSILNGKLGGIHTYVNDKRLNFDRYP